MLVQMESPLQGLDQLTVQPAAVIEAAIGPVTGIGVRVGSATMLGAIARPVAGVEGVEAHLAACQPLLAAALDRGLPGG